MKQAKLGEHSISVAVHKIACHVTNFPNVQVGEKSGCNLKKKKPVTDTGVSLGLLSGTAPGHGAHCCLFWCLKRKLVPKRYFAGAC